MWERTSWRTVMRALVSSSSSKRAVTWRVPAPGAQATEPPSAGTAGTEGHAPWGQDTPFPVPESTPPPTLGP